MWSVNHMIVFISILIYITEILIWIADWVIIRIRAFPKKHRFVYRYFFLKTRPRT